MRRRRDRPTLTARWLGLSILLVVAVAPGCHRRREAPPPPVLALSPEPFIRSPPQLGAGVGFTCQLSRAGKVTCWGDNALGQLGTPGRGRPANCVGENYAEEIEFPGRCSPEPMTIGNLAHVRQLAVGHSHACALRDDGSVWCWGDDWMGEIGVGDGGGVEASCRDDVPCARVPVPVPGLRARAIAAGGSHTCAVLLDGRLACWGDASMGEIPGARDRCTASHVECAHSPIVVQGLTDVVQVAVGGWHICALRATGQVSCWGGNDEGQAGVARDQGARCQRDYPCVRVPTPVAGLAARQIVAGYFHTCALDAAGAPRCWGRDDSGELGAGTAPERCSGLLGAETPCSSTPLAVRGLGRVTRLASGASCALLGDGAVACWGRDERGQLGIGGATGRCLMNGTDALPCSREAVRVPGLTDVIDVATSGTHACALDGAGRILCWGSAGQGEIGPPPAPLELCTYISPDQKEPCVRRPRRLPQPPW